MSQTEKSDTSAQAEYFAVLQWIYPQDEEEVECWAFSEARIVALSMDVGTGESFVGVEEGFEIAFGKRWICLRIGQERWGHPGYRLPEVWYPADTREIFFCTEGKNQQLYRATFFPSLQEAEAFLAQCKTPKEE